MHRPPAQLLRRERGEIATGETDYDESHIPGSAFVDLIDELRDAGRPELMFPMPPADQFASVMSGLGVGEGTRVVPYDRMVNWWATRVWWMLRAFGFENAAVLDGGWAKWSAEGRPVSTERAAYPAIDDESTCIITALDADEYAGRGPRRYGRGSHIPSSVNVSFLSILDLETNTYLPSDQLRDQFAVVGAFEGDRVVT